MNLHLLVPELFLADSAGMDPYHGLALPALETLLARGATRRLAGSSLERWLAATFGIAARHDLPLAALSLRGEGVDPGSACWLRADPVHLEARHDHVLLADAGGLEIDAREAGALVAALNAHFAVEGLEFVAPDPRRWYVRAPDEPRIRTTPTAEAAGRSIERLLPEGEDGPRWRRIINEAQMLLHAHACNEVRETRGALTVNSLWFWGTGRAPEIPCAAPYGAVWTSHPLAAGIATTAGVALQPLPRSGEPSLALFADRARDKPHLLVLDALREGLCGGPAAWRRALAELERTWFAPLFEGLKRGALVSLTLHGLGPDRACAVTVSRVDRLKLWRRRRPLGYFAS